MADEPASAPGQLKLSPSLKEMILRSMFAMADYANTKNLKEGQPSEIQVVLFTTFGTVVGTLNNGENPGAVEWALGKAWEVIRNKLESIPGVTPIETHHHLVLKNARISPYGQFPQATLTYAVDELVLFVDSVQAVGIGELTIKNS